MITGPDRRARRLRLRATSEASACRGATLVEDALRTASVPEAEGGRVLLVRHLSLGVIDPSASPSAVALRIEQRLQRLRAFAVHAEDLRGGAAEAIWFRDPTEAMAIAVLRIARNLATDEWPWRAVLPAGSSGGSREDRLRTCLFHAMSGGAAAGAALLRELQEREGTAEGGAADLAVGSLRWQDGGALLGLCGWRPSAGRELLPGPAQPSAVGTLLHLLERWARRWGSEDARSVWLGGMTLVAASPSRLMDPGIESRARAAARWAVEAASEAGGTARQPSPQGSVGDGGDPLPTIVPRAGISRSGGASPVADRAGAENDRQELRPFEAERFRGPMAEEVAPLQEPLPHSVQSASDPAPTTSGGGLFFLISVLERLGIREILAREPMLLECDLPQRLLRRITRGVDLPAEDPVLAALQPVHSAPHPHLRFVAPTSWRDSVCRTGEWRLQRRFRTTRLLADATGRLPVAILRRPLDPEIAALIQGEAVTLDSIPAPSGGSDFEIVEHALHLATRRWCRRYAGLGLRDIVRRPASVAVTWTHIDVRLDSRLADVRIRRAGLDLNPGWVPWLGRVVHFHYS